MNKEIKTLSKVRSLNEATVVYNDKGTPTIRLSTMFCPEARDYSKWCHDISYLGIPEDAKVAEFCFFVCGGHEEEQVRKYLGGFGVEVLEIWS